MSYLARKLRPAVPVGFSLVGLGDTECETRVKDGYNRGYVFGGSKIAWSGKVGIGLFTNAATLAQNLRDRLADTGYFNVQVWQDTAKVATFGVPGQVAKLRIWLYPQNDLAQIDDVAAHINWLAQEVFGKAPFDVEIAYGETYAETIKHVCEGAVPAGAQAPSKRPENKEDDAKSNRSSFSDWFNDIQKTLGIPKEVLIIGGVLLVIVAVKGR